MTQHYCASHLEKLFKPRDRKETIKRMVGLCSRLKHEMPALYAVAISGTSGILGALVADRVGLEIITVSPKRDSRHSNRTAEGLFRAGGYVIFDDLIDSGYTAYHIWNSINKECEEINRNGGLTTWDDQCNQIGPTPVVAPTLLGAVLYDSSWSNGTVANLCMFARINNDYDSTRCADVMPKFKVWTK